MMEYRVMAKRPFEETEAQAILALEQGGFVVQRTFSLRSAVGSGEGALQRPPGYSVLMLYAPGTQRDLLGLVSLYQREGHTVIRPVLNGPAPHKPATGNLKDIDAELVAALVAGGLEMCVHQGEGETCLALALAADGRVTDAGAGSAGPWGGPWPQ